MGAAVIPTEKMLNALVQQRGADAASVASGKRVRHGEGRKKRQATG